MASQIVFINQATGYLTIDIVNAFAREFDRVALISGSIRVQDTELDPRVKISSITKYNRGSNLRKAVSWLIGTIQIWLLLCFRYRKYEKFFFTIPPTAYLPALKLKQPFTILIYDLYPDALLMHRFSRQSLVYKWLAEKNRKVFNKAHRLYTISEGMRRQILDSCPHSDPLVIPNWSAFSMYTPVERDENTLIRKEGLQDKFIVQYSGNIGYSHNVEVLIEVAERLADEEGVMFQIIGRGEKSATIERLAESKGLKNCRFLPFREDALLYESLCAADLAVVTLDDRMPDISVPSKTYNIMAAGRPLLAIASEKSGLAALINEHDIGRVFEKDRIDDLAEFILRLKKEPAELSRYAANSLKASVKYTSDNAGLYLKSYID